MSDAPYPVHYAVAKPTSISHSQLFLRIIALAIVGVAGISLSAVFLAAYLMLPFYAAFRILAVGSSTYVTREGPRVLLGLRWISAMLSWIGLAADRLPTSTADEVVTLEVEGTASPSFLSALWRLLAGLPSAFVLSILCWVATFVWMWTALKILLTTNYSQRAHNYLAGVQRWSARLLVYQASLVDKYPPFSFEDDRASTGLPHARVVQER